MSSFKTRVILRKKQTKLTPTKHNFDPDKSKTSTLCKETDLHLFFIYKNMGGVAGLTPRGRLFMKPALIVRPQGSGGDTRCKKFTHAFLSYFVQGFMDKKGDFELNHAFVLKLLF